MFDDVPVANFFSFIDCCMSGCQADDIEIILRDFNVSPSFCGKGSVLYSRWLIFQIKLIKA